MKKFGQSALFVALVAGVAACGQQAANDAAPIAENVTLTEEMPANAIDNAAVATPPANDAATATNATQASPPRERARSEQPRPERPKAETPRPSPPAVDPHAGHDMNNMSH